MNTQLKLAKERIEKIYIAKTKKAWFFHKNRAILSSKLGKSIKMMHVTSFKTSCQIFTVMFLIQAQEDWQKQH